MPAVTGAQPNKKGIREMSVKVSGRSVVASTLLALAPCSLFADSEGAAETHHEHARNSINFGIASTREKDGERAPTFSVSYNHRFADEFSIGALVEYAVDPLHLWIVGAPLKYFPGGGWVLTAMPALEYHNSHSEPLFRLGVGYDFELEGGNTLAPEINIDFVDGSTDLVIGLAFGIGF